MVSPMRAFDPSQTHDYGSRCVIIDSPGIVDPDPPVRSPKEWRIWNVVEHDQVEASSTSTSTPTSTSLSIRTTTQTGRCHCGAVRFRCRDVPSNPLVVWDCNCSDCRLRRNAHFVLPRSSFEYSVGVANHDDDDDDDDEEKDKDKDKVAPPRLQEYRWGTGVARHYFCTRCGISPFYVPRSNPDGVAVTFACLDAIDEDNEENRLDDVQIRRFDGMHWEDFIANEGKAIRGMSKEQPADLSFD